MREQVHRIAARLETELGPEEDAGLRGCQQDWDGLPLPDLPLVVGLDGGYVHSATQTSRTDGWFEVMAGRSLPTGGEKPAKCFAFVQKIETKPRRRLHEVLHSQGVQANQTVVFLTDGGEDVRDLPRYLYPLSEHYLDWFHVTMRLTVLANMAKSLLPLPEVPDFAARIGADLDKLKWLLWHGNTFRADQVLSWLEDDLYTDPTENPPEAQVKLARYVSEFATYIRVNTHLIPNYGDRHRCGEAISSALAESTVNQVVAKRMVKKQQMRWSPAGAQLFLQVPPSSTTTWLAASAAGTRASPIPEAQPRSKSISPRNRPLTGHSGGRSPPDPNGLPALRHLVLQAPAPVIARTLGFHDQTTSRISIDAGKTWNQYAPGDHTQSP